jgi:hypothetical protein
MQISSPKSTAVNDLPNVWPALLAVRVQKQLRRSAADRESELPGQVRRIADA